MLQGKRILLIVAGGIAAYKSLELVRRLRERGASLRAVLTRSGAQFVTPLSLSALTEDKVYGELFDLTDEQEMGHIQLSRDADLLVVAPATADLLAKMAGGLADDLASTALLATDKPVLAAPAMKIEAALAGGGRLAGRRVLVTSGPTHEAIDPVRYIANRSSGKQGHAIAAALARLGAETHLVTGPVALPDPQGVTVTQVESAEEMLSACRAALPVDAAVCAAAVADWRVAEAAAQKMKKSGELPSLALTANPDILASLSEPGNQRPRLVVGFAAETEKLIENARAKLEKKACDWILANDVSSATGTFGGAENEIHLVSAQGVEDWPRMTKEAVAQRLAERIADHLDEGKAA
ncbi:MAG: bifunctional phosphopantothenoylcysteine decarboxylase/phosphopantothenate synthase [Limibacillus sp.]